MSDQADRPGLWLIPGDGVLARHGDLIVLTQLGERATVDRMLTALNAVHDGGGDGPQLLHAIEEIVAEDGETSAGDDAGGSPQGVLALGPAGPGLALFMSGVVWADLTSGYGVQRFVTGTPPMRLRGIISVPVQAVRAGFGDGTGPTGSTDWFSRLNSGSVRAGGFSYLLSGAGPHMDETPSVASPASRRDETAPRPVSPVTPAAAFEAVVLVGDRAEDADIRVPLPVGPSDAVHDDRVGGGPEVQGVYCKNGHFDDPKARFCAVCGISMNQQTLTPRQGLRPPLGLLVIDDGSVFQLDTDYVIGREPTLDASVAAGHARPLRLMDDGAMVSRLHAKIHLDGWQVQVTDLGSSNGTSIRASDGAVDHQLVPHVPVTLQPGSHVSLGGRGLHYESHRGR